MEDDGEDLTPFWMQSTTNRRRPDRIRNGLSSLFFSSGLLIILLLLMAVSFLVFVVPSTLSFSTQIFRPNSVKKSWDTINVVLVLVALIFGLLSRVTTNQDGNNDEYHLTTSPVSTNETRKSNPSTPQGKWYGYSANEARRSTFQEQWYGYSDGDHLAYNNSTITSSRGGGLRRTSSSYPDLLVEASPRFTSGSGDDPWRFYDDTGVDTYQVSDETGQIVRRRSWRDRFEDARVAETKNIYVDTFVNRHKETSNIPRPRPKSPSPSPSPPPPSPPPPSSSSLPKVKPKRAYRSVGHKGEGRSKRKGNNELEDKEPISSLVTPPLPPPPPPPPPALPQFVDQKSSKTDKKRSGGNSTKDFWNTLYHKKKKKQRQKSIENFDALLHQPQTPPLRFEFPQPYRPPPPPPPPPPPSVFHNLFSTKKSKRRRPEQDISATKSSSSQPIPAPANHPAEPSTSQFISVTAQKSPKPIKIRSFDSVEENSNSGGESPLIPIPPPPPPPPPFAKSLSWKFVMQGDYVRVDSSISSRSGSTDMDETESDSTPTAIDGADAKLLFFPSPDVNTKAENFITNFRAGLKQEKINSMNKRQGLGMSNLGRISDSTQL